MKSEFVWRDRVDQLWCLWVVDNDGDGGVDGGWEVRCLRW